jgi:hypothetical protein
MSAEPVSYQAVDDCKHNGIAVIARNVSSEPPAAPPAAPPTDNTQKTTDAPERSGLMATINKAINGTMERMLEKLGRFIGRRPWLTIVLSIIVMLGLGTGLVNLKFEDRCSPHFPAIPVTS